MARRFFNRQRGSDAREEDHEPKAIIAQERIFINLNSSLPTAASFW